MPKKMISDQATPFTLMVLGSWPSSTALLRPAREAVACA